MRIIHYIGMDVHTTNYTLCDLSRRINPISGDVEDRMGCPITIAPDYKLVVKFVDNLKSEQWSLKTQDLSTPSLVRNRRSRSIDSARQRTLPMAESTVVS